MLQTRALTERMAEVARVVTQSASLEDVLTNIVFSAARNIPGVEHAGIALADRQGVSTAASTGTLVEAVDRLQYELGEGPCIDALRGDSQGLVNDLARDRRWTRYGPQAADLGVGSQLSVELYREKGTCAALNLYSTKTWGLTEETTEMAAIFAIFAAAALGKAVTESQLTEALQSRKIIGQAIGIVMERYQLDEQRAFAFLSRLSQTSNVKLRTVASDLVQQANATNLPAAGG
jgi:GAF domain-containing protein